jgi:hypothetical protein
VRAITACITLLAACGGGPLKVETVTTRPDAPAWMANGARTALVAEEAARVWGADLGGWTVRTDDRYRFDYGCTYPDEQLVVVYVSTEACPEVTALAHEAGHVAIGDDDHQDARWHSAAFWAAMASALRTSAAGDEPCLDLLADPSAWWRDRWWR